MVSSFKPSAGALLPLEASLRQVRPLRHSNQAQRAVLAQHVQLLLQQWQSQWGIEASTAKVHCHAFTATTAETVLAAQTWKPLSRGIPSETIWWTLLAPSSAATRPGGGRARPNGAVLLAALSQSLFGESVNVQQESHLPARPVSTSISEEKGIPGTLREEPVIHAEATLAAELVFAAWTDWLQCVGQLFGYLEDVAPALRQADRAVLTDADARATHALPAEFLRNWSGTLYLSLPWCGNTLLLILPSTQVERFQLRATPAREAAAAGAARAAAVTPLWQALAAQTSTVEVKLAPLEIALGALTSLQVGDVVRTSHALDSPLIVTLRTAPGSMTSAEDEAGRLCEGYLGRQAGYRAVELL